MTLQRQSALAATADPEAPNEVDVSQPSATLLIGAVAGLLPALRAARLAPTEALRTA